MMASNLPAQIVDVQSQHKVKLPERYLRPVSFRGYGDAVTNWFFNERTNTAVIASREVKNQVLDHSESLEAQRLHYVDEVVISDQRVKIIKKLPNSHKLRPKNELMAFPDQTTYSKPIMHIVTEDKIQQSNDSSQNTTENHRPSPHIDATLK